MVDEAPKERVVLSYISAEKGIAWCEDCKVVFPIARACPACGGENGWMVLKLSEVTATADERELIEAVLNMRSYQRQGKLRSRSTLEERVDRLLIQWLSKRRRESKTKAITPG